MDSRWIKGSKDTEARKKQVLGFRTAFSELTQILEQDLKKKDAVRDYNSPNWAYEQIAVNEYNQVLADILKLINIKE